MIEDEEFYRELLGDFITESATNIQQAKQHLETLIQQGADADLELAGVVRRNVHTIKGGSAFIGFTNISALALAIEKIMQQVFQGEKAASEPLLSAMQQGVLFLEKLLETVESSNDSDIEGILATVQAFK